MKHTNTEMQKRHTTLVFLFLFVPVMFFAFTAILLPQFVFLAPLGLVVGHTAVLLNLPWYITRNEKNKLLI